MPFAPGEEVSIPPLITEHPERARLEFLGQAYTLQNHGLELKRKGRVHCTLRVPKTPGKYPYKWTDGEQVVTGNLRVQGARATQRDTPIVSEPRPSGVRARRYGQQ